MNDIRTFGSLTKASRRQFIAAAGSGLAFASFSGSMLLGGTRSSFASKIGGEIVSLEYAGYSDPEATASFLKQHGASVTVNPLTTPDEAITRLLGGGSRNISLVTPATFQIPMMVEAGVIEPVDYRRLPNTARYIPLVAEAAKSAGVDKQEYCAPYLWGLNALIYNEKFVEKAPTSWMDLTKPEFTNKICLTDVSNDNIPLWAKVLGYDPLNMTQEELGRVTDFLIDLKRTQARTFTNVFDDIAQQLASGDIVAVASPLWIGVGAMARGRGGDQVKWTLPKEGGATWIDGWALPKDGHNPDTAYAYIDHMIGVEAQVIVATKTGSGTVNQEAIPQLTGDARDAYPYGELAPLEQLAPPIELPAGTGGSVGYDDWVQAWNRVAAA